MDPICGFCYINPDAEKHANNVNVWPPNNYMEVIGSVNALQGGEVGEELQPIQFIENQSNYLVFNDEHTFDRFIGAMKSHYPNIKVVRSAPAALVTI